jgi:hypothetical protein
MKALPPHGESDLAGVTLRLDAPRDAKMLGDLARMNERRLDQGGFVVAEIDGRVVAALPLAGGEPLVDYFVRTAHLVRCSSSGRNRPDVRAARDLGGA